MKYHYNQLHTNISERLKQRISEKAMETGLSNNTIIKTAISNGLPSIRNASGYAKNVIRRIRVRNFRQAYSGIAERLMLRLHMGKITKVNAVIKVALVILLTHADDPNWSISKRDLSRRILYRRRCSHSTMYKGLNQIESFLPKHPHLKYNSRFTPNELIIKQAHRTIKALIGVNRKEYGVSELTYLVGK